MPMAAIKKLQRHVGGSSNLELKYDDDDGTEYNEMNNTSTKHTKGYAKIFEHKGLFFALLSALSYAFMGLGVNVLSTNVSPMEVTAIRTILLVIFALPLAVIGKPSFRLTPFQLKGTLMYSICTTIASITIFVAFGKMSIGDASAIVYSSSIFSGILGWIALKESLSPIEIGATVVTLVGVILVAKPPFLFGQHLDSEFGEDHFMGALFALCGSVCTGISSVVGRRMGLKAVHYLVLCIYFGVICAIVSTIVTTILTKWLSFTCFHNRLILVMVGFAGFVGLAFFNLALKHEKALNVSLILNNEILFSFVLQYTFQGIRPSLFSILGVACILISSVGIYLNKRKANQQN